MAERAAKTSTSAINPMFYIPEGVDELAYDNEEATLNNSLEETEINDTFVGEELGVDYSDKPATPDIYGVIDQSVRTAKAGNQVVDVILEVDDLGDDSRYQIRVTKL